jgi:hypothetical protein
VISFDNKNDWTRSLINEMTPIQSSNSSANKIAANRLHFDYIFYLATVHRQFFELATRPSILLKWLMDY